MRLTTATNIVSPPRPSRRWFRGDLPGRRSEQFRITLLSLLLAAATLAVYFPAGGFDFTNYDDPDYVTANSQVGLGLTWPGIIWAFQTTHAGNWHPLTWLSHMLDVQFFGMNAGMHHLTNIVLHAANAVLLLLALRKLTGNVWASLVVAALFALHPAHVESVAWVAERKDLLSSFFGLFSLLIYAKYARLEISNSSTKVEPHQSKVISGPLRTTRRNQSRILYFSSLTLFSLSLLSKPMLVTLPFLLLLLDFWPLQRLTGERKASESDSRSDRSTHNPILSIPVSRWTLLREKIPFLALSIGSSLITLVAQVRGESVATLEDLPPGLRLKNALVAYVGYLKSAIWPRKLAVFYPHPGTWDSSLVLGAALLLLAITILVFRFGSKRGYLITGWLWFLGALIPIIGLVQVGMQSHADRYTYLPFIGLFILAVWGPPDLLSRWNYAKTASASLAAVGLLACGIATHFQLRHWSNSENLFAHALHVTSSNYVAYVNLGLALFDRGKTNEGLANFVEAARVRPGYPPALSSIGMALLARNKTNEAVSFYQQTLQSDPRFAQAHYDLGTIAFAEGRRQEAIDHFAAALRKRPNFPEAHYNLAVALAAQNEIALAIPRFESALKQKPHDADIHNNFGIALANQGGFDEAINQFKLSLDARPEFAAAHYNQAEALLQQGRVKEALAEYDQAIRCRPQWIEAMNNVAWLLATHPASEARNGPKALALAEQACRLTPHPDISLLQTLAAAEAECGQFTQAVATARSAYELAIASGQTAWTNTARARLDLYNSRQPFRQTPAH